MVWHGAAAGLSAAALDICSFVIFLPTFGTAVLIALRYAVFYSVSSLLRKVTVMTVPASTWVPGAGSWAMATAPVPDR